MYPHDSISALFRHEASWLLSLVSLAVIRLHQLSKLPIDPEVTIHLVLIIRFPALLPLPWF